MTKKIKRKSDRQIKKISESPFSIYWEKTNYYFLAAGILVVILGFYFLSIGPWNSFASLVIAPILLFIGYILVFPASILYRKKSVEDNTQGENNAPGQS